MLCKNIHNQLCQMMNEHEECQSKMLLDEVRLTRNAEDIELSFYFWEHLSPAQIELYEAQNFDSKKDYLAYFAEQCPRLHHLIESHFSKADELDRYINLHNQFISIRLTTRYAIQGNLLQLQKRILSRMSMFIKDYRNLEKAQAGKPLSKENAPFTINVKEE